MKKASLETDSNHSAPPSRTRLVFEALEGRQLLSADIFPALRDWAPTEAAPPPPAVYVDAQPETAAPAPNRNAAIHSSTELVLVDNAVSDISTLLTDLRAQRAAGRDFTVVLLNAQDDGIAQISDALSKQQDLTAVHIISHGSQGAIRIGATTLDAHVALARGAELRQWSNALARGADILLYGCEAGAKDGEGLMAALRELIGADIAASNDVTGNLALGGDWQLESRLGVVQTEIAITPHAQATWLGTLPTVNLNPTQDNSIRLQSPTFNYGASTSLILDRETTDLQRILLQFDLSSIPMGSTITSATLRMQNTQIGGTLNISVYEVLQSWAEGSFNGASGNANWNNRTGANAWTTSGGDFNTTAAANINTNATGLHSWDITSLVQAWVNGTSTNNGLMVASPDGGGNRTATYDSREGATPPELQITYTAAINTAPTLDASRSPTLSNVAEDSGAPTGAVGTLVSQLVDFASPSGQVDNVTDPDIGAQLGIAVTGANTANGSWWYSTDNGGSWSALGSVANNNARLLAADTNTRLYFQPNANFSGTLLSGVTFRAWDQTSGANGALADTSSNGGSTAFSSAFDNASILISAVNDAPVNTVPSAQLVARDMPLVFSTANGNAISIFDVDAGASPVRITLNVSNGSLTLSGTTGLTFTTGDGAADATMTFSGLVSDINAALNGLSFVPAASYTGSALLQITANDQGNTGSGGTLSDVDAVTISVSETAFWLSSNTTATSSAGSGNLTWSNGQVVRFGPPALSLGAGTTSGTFSHVFDIDTFAGGDANVRGLHYVTRTVTVGGGANIITLQAGDVLLSVTANETLGGVAVSKNDIVLFRPTTAGNYGSGTFSILLQDPTGKQVGDFALIEHDITIGGALVDAGSLLISEPSKNDLSLYKPLGAGAGTTSGIETALFIDGAGLNINPGLMGVEIVQYATVLGGVTLNPGQLLITLNANDSTVGTNNLSVSMHDIVVLTITSTGAGSTSGTASGLFTGADVGMSAAGEEFDALALVQTTSAAPVVTLNATPLSYTENDPAAVIDATATVSDLDSPDFDNGLLHIQFTANGSVSDQIGIRNQGTAPGQIGVSGSTVTFGGLAIGTFTGGTDGFTPLIITLNSNADTVSVQALLRNLTYQNVSNAPSTATRTLTVTLNDGDGGTSAPQTKTIQLTALNDSPTTSGGSLAGINEDVANPVGQAIAVLIGSTFSDPDPGASLVGIAITANPNNALEGTYQYSTDGGVTWYAVSTVSGPTALVISASTELRFLPAANYNGTAAGLSFRAIDDSYAGGFTNGATRVITDTSLAGGTTPFSSTLNQINISVSAVNDAPLLDITRTPVLNNTVEDAGAPSGAAGTLISSIIDFATPVGQVDNVTDPDAGAQLGIAVVGADTTNGTWWYTIDSGSTWSALGAVATNNSRLLAADAATRVYFQPNANFSTDVATITIRAWDQTFGINGSLESTTVNGGSMPYSSATDGVSVFVSAVNDAPVNTVPSAQNTNEDTALVFSSGNGNQLSIADIDAVAGLMEVTLSVTDGTLTLAGTGGLTFSSGSNGSATMTVTGTVTDINAALNGMNYLPAASFNGAATLTITTNDQGNVGAGGALADTDNVTINVSALNDAPTATIVPNAFSAAENVTLTLHGTGLSVADLDAGSATVTVTLDVTQGTLNAAAGATGAIVSGSGTNTLTFAGTLAQINSLLAGNNGATLNYINNNDAPAASATLTLSIDDGGNAGAGGALTAFDTATINITAVNDAPVLAGANALTSIYQNPATNPGTQVSALIAGQIMDLDTGAQMGVAVVGADTANGTWEFSTNSGATWNTLGAPSAATARLLAADSATLVRFVPNPGFFGTAALTLRAWDQTSGVNGAIADVSANGGATAFSAGTAMTVINVISADAPVHILPTSPTATTGASIGINGVSVSDLQNNVTSVALSVLNGTINVTLSGATVVNAGALGSASLTLSGTHADLNATLATLTYVSNAGFTGTDTLTIQSVDATTLSTTDTLAIAVVASPASPNVPPPVTPSPTISPTVAPLSLESVLNISLASSSNEEITARAIRAGSNGTAADLTPQLESFGQTTISTRNANLAPSLLVMPVPRTPNVGKKAAANTSAGADANAQNMPVLIDEQRVQILTKSLPSVPAQRTDSVTAPVAQRFPTGPMSTAAEREFVKKTAFTVRSNEGPPEDLSQPTTAPEQWVRVGRVMGLALSVGVVTWVLRAAGMLSSLLAALPAWRHVDPLPILGKDDEDNPAERWSPATPQSAQEEQAAQKVLEHA